MAGEAPAGSWPDKLGEFRITGLLGEGAYGTVYAAERDVVPGADGPRQLALKVLRADILPTERQRKQFLQEATLLAAIDHPGVVQVLGFGLLPDDRPYLAMQRLEGESLAAALLRGPLPLAEALALFAQLADAVGALHARGLLHRDVKPENVYLVRAGDGARRAVLFDFGIAKGAEAPLSTMTQDGAVRGTPAYMAPERFFGAPASVGSEVYELAVTLYAMLAARLPWDDSGDPESRLSPRPPSAYGVLVPAELEVELSRALSTRAEKRPASVAELAARIAAAVAGSGGTVRRTVDLPAAESGPVVAPGASAGLRVPQPTTGGRATAATAGAPDTSTLQTRARSRWTSVALALAAVGVASGVGAIVGRIAWKDAVSEAPRDAGPEPPTPSPTPAPAPEPLPPPGPRHPARFPAVPASAWTHHPADTAVLLGLSWTQVVAAKPVAEARADRKDDPPPALARFRRTCGFNPLAELEWLTFGVGATPGGKDIDVIVAGRWTRDELEPCLQELMDSPLSRVTFERDGRVTLLKYSGKAYGLGWLDEHTVMFSTRAGADRAWIEARLDGKDGGATKAPVAAARRNADGEATLWLVALPRRYGTEPIAPGIALPEQMTGEIALAADVRGELRWRYASADEAAGVQRAMAAYLSEARKDPAVALVLGKTEVRAEGTQVIVSLVLDETGTRAVVEGTIEALATQLKAL